MGSTGASGAIDLTSDTIEVALFSTSTSYSFNPDHTYVADVFDGGTTGQEFSGSGYARQSLGGKSAAVDNGNDRGEFDANDVTFSSIDGDEIQAALVYKVGPTDDTDSPLVAHITSSDFPLQTNGGDVTLSWDSNGIVHIT